MLGAVGTGDFGLASGSLSSSPGEGSSRREEQNPLVARGVEHSEELERNMQDPVHTSSGFGNSMKLSWEGSLGIGRNEGPWRPLTGRRHLDAPRVDEAWRLQAAQGLTVVDHVNDPWHPTTRRDYLGGAAPAGNVSTRRITWVGQCLLEASQPEKSTWVE